MQGNTLTDPKFKDGDTLKTFDYVVANPPFSDKRWSTGLDPLNDPYERFKPFGTPPGKQGDYAYLLHIVRSLKSTGKGACILPHGVLFRGNAEADIRRTLVRKGYIKGIIGLPANLFYGTGIPACIVVIDKEDAQARKGIFMIDASGGFMKDGPKNRLREQDIHKIVDVFNKRLEVPKYARMVTIEEIEKNEFNLNLPRYIDSQTPEDLQDIEGHLRGGIPERRRRCARPLLGRLSHSSGSTLFKELPPRLPRPRRREAGDQVHHLRAPRVRRLHRRHERPLRRLAEGTRRYAQRLESWLPSEGSHRRARRGPARPLRRQAAHRRLRRLPAPAWTTGPRPCRTTAT